MENYKNVQFVKFLKFVIWKIKKFAVWKIFNFENFKNSECGEFEKFAISKILKISQILHLQLWTINFFQNTAIWETTYTNSMNLQFHKLPSNQIYKLSTNIKIKNKYENKKIE